MVRRYHDESVQSDFVINTPKQISCQLPPPGNALMNSVGLGPEYLHQ